MSLPSIPPPPAPPGLPSIDPPALPPIPPAPPIPPVPAPSHPAVPPASVSPSPSLPDAIVSEISEPAPPSSPPAMPEATSEIVTNDEKQQTVEGEVSAVEQAVTEVVSVTEEKAVVDKPIDEQAQHTAPTEPNIIKTSPDAPPSQGEDSREDTGVPSDDEPHVVEKVVEKIVPADITESDKDRIFSARLAALSIKGNAARLKRQQENHAAIIGYLKQHGYATNNEIEKLCHVADSTATKYLKALERQGLVMQVGRRGRNLRWRLKEGSN